MIFDCDFSQSGISLSLFFISKIFFDNKNSGGKFIFITVDKIFSIFKAIHSRQRKEYECGIFFAFAFAKKRIWMKNIKSTFKVLRTDVELDFKEISYLDNFGVYQYK